MLERQEFPVLLVAAVQRRRAAGQTLSRIVAQLQALGHRVVQAETLEDGRALVASDPSFACVVLDWGLGSDGHEDAAMAVIGAARTRSERLPIFLMLEREQLGELPLAVTETVQECVLVLEDTPAFVAGRIDFAWRRYTDALLPPYFRTLLEYGDTHEYSMHTPGHAGGTAFRKTPVGKAFYDFYGENLFRTDLAVALGPLRELGSLLDHSGRVKEAEANAARIFGAEQTYFVLNGTSTANQIVAHSAIVAGDVVLADRNCHKSMNHALTVTDAIPSYLRPTRNGYGLIGPIPARELSRRAVAAALGASPLAAGAEQRAPVYAAITNSTYDGLCYDARRVSEALAPSVPRIHFDEAWFGYARFHPLYRDRYAMHDEPAADGPTLYATQSTHKLLAAFSQSSMIHIRSSPRAPVEPSRFNEAYMMHGSTSPFYPMIACLDVAAAMMDGPGGFALTDEAIREAIAFRKRMLTVESELRERDGEHGWFFGVWQPEYVTDPDTGEHRPFAQTPDQLLAGERRCWLLEPGAAWHGFGEIEQGLCMLDPIKVTVTTPGIDAAGALAERGIPAVVVTLFLEAQRIEVEKTGDYSFLVLFSIGMTKGKWGTLLDGLLAFKRAYDANTPLAVAIPELVTEAPQRYRELGVRDLCEQMHEQMRARRLPALLDDAFRELPEARLTPGESYRRLVRGASERLRLLEMGERTAAVMVVPYPPGIPILMPGESAGAVQGPLLGYLTALQEFDRSFPGFEHDIHGVERDASGAYLIECLSASL
ncbi:MAG TPA: Orn/Lys/Arg decarboxylase N-terminal domain-containing protein [Solirubrobacteraceae bacterium]|nr:Orn/Lys/Arg decarboxylase N-terminal domain-containing protein [Solirubrobacteraceae bacterium]